MQRQCDLVGAVNRPCLAGCPHQLCVLLRRAGQALALVREPTNPADPNAVAVQALDGTTLGYIPRDETQRFQQPLCFGAVYSAGQAADGGNWGFRVRTAMN